MASRFTSVSEEEILSVNDEAVLKNKNMAAILMYTVLNGKLFLSPTSYSKAKNQNTVACLRKLLSTKITM